MCPLLYFKTIFSNLLFCADYITAAHARTVWKTNNLPVSFNAYPKCIFMALLHSPYLRHQTWIWTQWTTASTLSISLKENHTYYQMWHSEQMLVLKEHWSSSLVQHTPPQLQEKTGSILTEKKHLIQGSTVNFRHDKEKVSWVLLQEEPATKPKAAYGYKLKSAWFRSRITTCETLEVWLRKSRKAPI